MTSSGDDGSSSLGASQLPEYVIDEKMDWDHRSEEAGREETRRTLDKAIGTYIKDWRLFQEPLQNAIDSFIDVDSGQPLDFGENHVPKITITLDAITNQVSIQDNGIGIKYDDRGFLTRPFLGTKDEVSMDENDRPRRRALKGSQGIGLKATVFSSKKFEIETKRFGESQGWGWYPEGLCSVPKKGEPRGQEIPRPEPQNLENHGTKIVVTEGYDTDEERYNPEEEGWHVVDFLKEKLDDWRSDFNLVIEQIEPFRDYIQYQVNQLRAEKNKASQDTKAQRARERIEEIEAIGHMTPQLRNEKESEKRRLENAKQKIGEHEKSIKSYKIGKEFVKQGFEEHRKKIKERWDSKNASKAIQSVKSKVASARKEYDTNKTKDNQIKIWKTLMEISNEIPAPTHQKVRTKGTAHDPGFRVNLGSVFKHYLSTRTYAADMSRVLGVDLPDVEIEYKIILNERAKTWLKVVKDDLEYTGTLLVGYRTTDTARNEKTQNPDTSVTIKDWCQDDVNFVDDIEEVVKCGVKGSVEMRNRVFQGIWTSRESIESALSTMSAGSKDPESEEGRKPLTDEEKKAVRAGLNRINGIYAVVSSSEFLRARLGFSPTQYFSVNGLPIHASVNLAGAGNLGARSQVHLVVDIDSELGIGKRNVSVHGNILNSINRAMVYFWNRTLVPIARAVSAELTNDETSDQDFTVQALAYIEDESKFTVMQREFGRITLPTSEQDVIQMHIYNQGKNETLSNWKALSTATNIDGRADPEYDSQGDPIKIEYKGPGSAVQLVQNEINPLSKQKFGDYDIAVVWDLPTHEYYISKSCRRVDFSSETEKEKRKYPNFQGYNRRFMTRITRGGSTSYILSLKRMFETLVEEQNTSQEEPESTEDPITSSEQNQNTDNDDPLEGLF